MINKHHNPLSLTLMIVSISFLYTGAFANNENTEQSKNTKTPVLTVTSPNAETPPVGDPWPLSLCPVSGMEVGSMGEPITRYHEDREVRLCCEGCIEKFEADPVKYLLKADKAIREAQESLYPIDYCIIDTSEKIAADEAENHYAIIGNRLFIFCCPPCEKKVRADPGPYFEILDTATIEAQKSSYPLEHCTVTNKSLESDAHPVDYAIGHRLFRLCSDSCVADLKSNLNNHVKKLEAAQSGYICSMHPEVHQISSGRCPKCEMTLTPKINSADK